ncbi:hypothetical protein QLX08_011271 [Tetragonisca angustula]|uniref:Uncharacterized protein n=1 Tax=Tetragonisca angustula TaxID=166442 RepID=A0AAW0Z9E5_9HYME
MQSITGYTVRSRVATLTSVAFFDTRAPCRTETTKTVELNGPSVSLSRRQLNAHTPKKAGLIGRPHARERPTKVDCQLSQHHDTPRICSSGGKPVHPASTHYDNLDCSREM